MQTKKYTNSSSDRHLHIVTIIFIVTILMAVFTTSASEININPVSYEHYSTQQLLHNTPRVGHLSSQWDNFVASINWADYRPSAKRLVSTNCVEAC